jgi:hypothetical protein
VATLGEIVDAALSEGGIDATPAQALVWGNDRYRRLVAGSKWLRLKRALGTTAAGQATYPLADDIVDVLSVRVAQSAPYRLITIDALWELQGGESFRATTRGLFAPAYDDDSQAESIELYPVPEMGGDTLTALVAVLPPALAATDTPQVPEDFHMTGIKAGVIADGLKLIDEQHQEGSVWEGEFQQAIEDLRRRRNSRVGRGPTPIRLLR